MPRSFSRRALLVLLSGWSVWVSSCYGREVNQRPVIRLWLNAPLDEVISLSTYEFSIDFKNANPGSGVIVTPHVVVIDEPGFTLRFDQAASRPTLPTSIGTSYRYLASEPLPYVQNFSCFVLPDYVSLRSALAEARRLRQALLGKGFTPVARDWLSRFSAIRSAVPPSLESFEDFEEAFLRSEFFAESAHILDLSKGRMRVELRLLKESLQNPVPIRVAHEAMT